MAVAVAGRPQDRAEVEPERSLVPALIWIAIVYLVYVWDRLVVPLLLPELQRHLAISNAQAGLLASIFTLGLALTAIPAGAVVLRLGTRTTLVIGTVIFSLFTAYITVAIGFFDMAFARVLTGVGEGLYNVAVFSFLGSLTVRYRGLANGAAASMFGIGAATSPLLIGWITATTGNWHIAFYALTVLGLLGALGLWFSLGHLPAATNAQRKPITLARIRRVLTPRNVMVCGIMAICGVGVYAFYAVYPHYLRVDLHMDMKTAALILSVQGIGTILGGAPCGLLADRIGRKRYLAGAAIVISVLGVALFVAPPVPWIAMAICLVLGAALNSVYANSYALIQDQVDKEEIPLATGVLAAIYFMTASVSGWLLITAQASYGKFGGAVLVYGIPYLLIAVVLVSIMVTERTRK